MSTLAKFNQVEEALKAKIESVLGAGRVAVGLYAPTPQFPSGSPDRAVGLRRRGRDQHETHET
jgi:hypothetical protein